MVRFLNTVDGIFVTTFSSLWSSATLEGKSTQVLSLISTSCYRLIIPALRMSWALSSANFVCGFQVIFLYNCT